MRQLKRRVVPVAVALLLGAAAAQAQVPQGPAAQGPGLHGSWPQGPGPHGSGAQAGLDEGRARGRHAGISQALGLSEEQQEQLRAIQDEQRPQLEALHEKIGANRDALHALLESASADAAAVGELVLEGRRLHEEARALRESQQKAIRGLLTPEQQKKFDAMKERHRGFGPRGGQGGMPGGPGAPGMQKPRQPRPGQPPAQP